jgi:hypothetical protein
MVKDFNGRIQTHPELADVVNHSLYDKTNTISYIRGWYDIWYCIWNNVVSY